MLNGDHVKVYVCLNDLRYTLESLIDAGSPTTYLRFTEVIFIYQTPP